MLTIASIGSMQAQITAPAVEQRADDDPRYLQGAIPTVDGHAIIVRDIDVPAGLTPEQVIPQLDSWLERCMKDERVHYNQRLEQITSTTLQQMVTLELTFSKNFIAHDYADLTYVLVLDASEQGKVKMTMTRIAFRYNEGDKLVKYAAEDLIADKVALNKKGKIIYGYKKFRTKTIDLMDELTASLQKVLQ